LIKVIGKGSFGKVFLVEDVKNGNVHAMKSIRKDVIIDLEQIESTKLEKEILMQLEHTFIISMDYVFQTDVRIYFLMKFAKYHYFFNIRGGELFKHLCDTKRFEEDRVKFYAAQVVLALGHLHENNVIYRDLKPENILLGDDGYILLADFGLAKIIESE
jgi:serine/threonine protein kinase